MRAELERLWHDERPKVTADVQAAAAQGDRSENAEYIYGKKRLREIDRRLNFLKKRLRSALLNLGGESNSSSSSVLKIFILAMEVLTRGNHAGIVYTLNDRLYDKEN